MEVAAAVGTRGGPLAPAVRCEGTDQVEGYFQLPGASPKGGEGGRCVPGREGVCKKCGQRAASELSQ